MTGALALFAGVLLGLGSTSLPGSVWMPLAIASGTLSLATPFRRRACVRACAALLFGMALVWSAAGHWMQLHLAASADTPRLQFEGVIRTIPAQDGTELHFDMDGVIVEGMNDARPRRARILWRNASVVPRAGERWRLLLHLAPLAETRNFADPEPARFAFRDGVHFAGWVLPSTLNTRLAPAGVSVDTLRVRVAAAIRSQVADPDAAALLTALAVGLTDRMSADQWRVFNATGTTHLVAISGLHVTLFALAAFFIARIVWRWLPGAHRVEREPFALLLGLAAAGGYSLLAGFSVPTLRTWLMLGFFSFARLAARHVGAGRIWALAVVTILVFDPFAPLAAGFWLSFVAVGVILMTAGTTRGEPPTLPARFRGAIRLQLAIMLALAPLTFAVFDALSVAGLWVNLLAIPFVSFVLVPLVLGGALAVLVWPAASHVFFAVAAALYDFTWPGLAWAADGAFALFRASPPVWWFAFAMLAGVVLAMRWPWALRFPAICAALPLLFAPSRMPAAGTARVSILDAGRGTAALVATHSHVLLFDTGDGWNTRGTRLRSLVFPALDMLGRDVVDVLVLPALNEDRAHSAALLAFERRMRRVIVGGGWPASSLPVQSCGDSSFRWDSVDFQLFAAGRAGRFCVLRVSTSSHAILLAGDLDAAAERSLIARLPSRALASDVATLPRQASAGASSAEWIEASAAKLAIATGGIARAISRDATLERWRRSGAIVLDTRREGGVQLGLGTDGVTVIRADSARYPFVWRRVR